MKTTIIRFAAHSVVPKVLAAAMSVALVACSSDDETDSTRNGVESNLQPVKFAVTAKPTALSSKVTTGTYDSETGKYPMLWASEDRIYICSPQAYSNSTRGCLPYNIYTIDGNTNTLTSDKTTATLKTGDKPQGVSSGTSICWATNADTKHTFYGFYPIGGTYKGLVGYGTTSLNIIEVNDQTNSETSYNEWRYRPMLWGKSDEVTRPEDDETPVEVKFEPIETVLDIKVYNKSFYSLYLTGIGVQVESSDGTKRNIAGDFKLTCADGTVSGGTMPTVYTTNIDTYSNSSSGSSNKFRTRSNATGSKSDQILTRSNPSTFVQTIIANGEYGEVYLSFLLTKEISTSDKVVIYLYCDSFTESVDGDITSDQYYKVEITPQQAIKAAPNGTLYNVALEYKVNTLSLIDWKLSAAGYNYIF